MSRACAPQLCRSSWNYFANDINETVIMQMADAMVSTGLAKAGYEYINVDAGYLVHARDPASGKLVASRVHAQRTPRAHVQHTSQLQDVN